MKPDNRCTGLKTECPVVNVLAIVIPAIVLYVSTVQVCLVPWDFLFPIRKAEFLVSLSSPHTIYLTQHIGRQFRAI